MQDGDALSLRRIFTGRCKRYEVGATHAQSLDPRNPVFASTLRRCVELIRAAAASALDAAGTASLPAEGPIVLWPACCRSFVGLLPALTIVA